MSQSESHGKLVSEITRWISEQTTYASEMVIYVDHINAAANSRPPVVGSSVPDLFGSSVTIGKALIGEAKTKNDIENKHCRRQLCDYLVFLNEWNHGHLVIAVPWQCTNQMRSLIRFLQKKTATQNVKVTILKQLPC